MTPTRILAITGGVLCGLSFQQNIMFIVGIAGVVIICLAFHPVFDGVP